MTRRLVLLLAAGIVLLPARDITAQEKKETANVAGTWVLEVETSAGSGTPTFTFKQEGEKIEGDYKGALGEAKVTGTVKGNTISFWFTVEAQGASGKVTYDGTVDGDTMKGKVDMAAMAEGTFTGKRSSSSAPR
jgi:hypothetical protein